MSTAVAKNWGVFGWNYNRGNFKYDQGLRWQRFTAGRKMAVAQAGMFRQDVSDLAGVSMAKLKVYGPIYGIVITVCVTVFVEGRSGLKFPGPPVFISGIYLQCLGIGMGFMALATWLLFHSAIRAQIACVQLRTRMVRVPVPTQRQLDGSRKLLSTWEEQGLYDMFRIPLVMPNGAKSPEASSEEEEAGKKAGRAGYSRGGIPGAAAKMKTKVKEAHKEGATGRNARVPGFTPGHPSWYEKELQEGEEPAESAPGAEGADAATAPYEHFELLREAQKDWWGCEAYMRVCFLYGMMHLIMAFSYWITLHNISELQLIWCSNLGAAGLTAGVWIMFRLDVLPEYGGCFPVEISGPFVTSIALGLMYSHTVTQTMMDIARGVAMLIIIMHVLLMFRLYAVAKPTNGKAHHQARESGGRLFNASGACDNPSWLPSAFQHVMYLVAPPKTNEQLEQERTDRENGALGDDPLAKVDMTPWHYVRTLIFVVALGWMVQLAGHTVECVMGERMLVSNGGAPPWSRAGQWYGWEHGPVSSKHYSHVTPQRGHWAWQNGWGPNGQQELWPSDMFALSPEADSWWAEDLGPKPLVGAAGFGENTWAAGKIAYGQNEPKWGQHHVNEHDFADSNGHRRLSSAAQVLLRPLVPVPVQWPAMMEPDLLACGPPSAGGRVAALTAGGLGAFVPSSVAGGVATAFALEGLLELGMAHSVTWGDERFLVVTGSGAIASCPTKTALEGTRKSRCLPLPAPPVPGLTPGTAGMAPAAAIANHGGAAVRAAVATSGGRVVLLDAEGTDGRAWREVGAVQLPRDSPEMSRQPEVAAIAASGGHLLVLGDNGVAYTWELQDGLPVPLEPTREAPAAGKQRTWQSACVLPSGKAMRLASTWLHGTGGASTLRQELLV